MVNGAYDIDAVRSKQAGHTTKKGFYIGVEGGEGSGKSIQAGNISRYLLEKNFQVESIKEPIFLDKFEKITTFILENPSMDPFTQALLFAAVGRDMTKKKIIPTINKGISIVSDRTRYSLLAHQGYGGQQDKQFIKELINKSYMVGTQEINEGKGIAPDLVFILDIDAEEGMKRSSKKDFFKKDDPEYHERVNECYRKMPEYFKNCVLIKQRNEEEMFKKIIGHLETRLGY